MHPTLSNSDFFLNDPPAQPVVQGYPFLFFDNVLKQTPESLEVLKNVSSDEWCAGPGGVLPTWVILEIMAQAAGHLARLLVTDIPYGHRLLTRIKRAKFRRPVCPGDSLRVSVRLLNRFNRSTAFTVTVGVETARMAEADFYFFHF